MTTSHAVRAATLLVLGDSLGAAYGLEKSEQGWVALLGEKLGPRGWTIANASISGETTAGGLQRLDELLERHKPQWVILELGANDGLRGLSLAQMEANLNQMAERSQATGARVLLLGMKIPPNYGKKYTEGFEAVYRKIAEQRKIAWVPFFLEGVGGHPDLVQADGLHPNLAAQPIILQNVWPVLEKLLKPADR